MNLDEIKTKAKDASDNTVLMLLDELERLNQKSQKLVEALEFYAKHENWEVSAINNVCSVKTKLTKDRESFREVDQPGLASKLVFYGGKLARQALKEWEA